MENLIITKEILELIDKFKLSLDEKTRLEEETKLNNSTISDVKSRLAQAMLEAEIDQVGRHGINWKLKPTTKYSKKDGADEELFELLRNYGMEHIIKKSVNAQTLNSVMNELAIENNDELPNDFAKVINIYEYMDISHRKLANKK